MFTWKSGTISRTPAYQAISLGLGSVIIGAFNDADMKHVMKLDTDEQPL